MENTAEFLIVKNEGFKSIAARLSQATLIKSITIFKLYALFTGTAQKFQPGSYKLSQTMSVPEIVATLTSRGSNEISITIPEGSTVRDIEFILTRAGVLTEGEKVLSDYQPSAFVETRPYLSDANSFEGFLFPDTYRFEIGSKPTVVLEVFLNNFEEKAWPLIREEPDWYATITLASLLEREVPEFPDRQIVAGILLKRMKIRMPLQVDATIGYVKCEGQFKECAVVTVRKSDLKTPSPYNTYLHIGLPPTPIANPGTASLQAALTPTASPYLYYLSASTTQETYFSKTLEEHNDKRARYL